MLSDARKRPGRSDRSHLVLSALTALALLPAGCAEVEVGAEAYKTFHQAGNPSTTRQATSSPARQVSVNPALQPDRAAFYATGVTRWDGTPTLPGIWVTHPMTTTARRVRLTNQETGLQADAALLRGDPGAAGPSITVSSEAAQALRLRPGQATPITIEGLIHAPAPVTPPGSLETAPIDAASPAPATGPATVEAAAAPDSAVPYAAEAVLAAETESGLTPAARPASQPGPQPTAQAAPAPTSGDITDGLNYIQAGIFRQPENAARLTERLSAAELPVHSQALTLGGQAVTRVLVGPYTSVAARNAALEAVRALGPADAIPARG